MKHIIEYTKLFYKVQTRIGVSALPIPIPRRLFDIVPHAHDLPFLSIAMVKFSPAEI